MEGGPGQEPSANRVPWEWKGASQNHRPWLIGISDNHQVAEELTSSRPSMNTATIPLDKDGRLASRTQLCEPYVGMEFESASAAHAYYELYGRHLGFTIRTRRTRRSEKDNSIVSRQFVCSKEGSRAGAKRNADTDKSPSGRQGCNAMMRIAVKEGGKWVISACVKEHNHELPSSESPPPMPTEMPPSRSRVTFCEDEKDLRIRLLTAELQREERKCEVYKENLRIISEFLETQTQHLHQQVETVVKKIKELESEDQGSKL